MKKIELYKENDFDDRASVHLYYSTNNSLDSDDITTTTSNDSVYVTGLDDPGAIALADTLWEEEITNGYIVWNWDVDTLKPDKGTLHYMRLPMTSQISIFLPPTVWIQLTAWKA